MWARSRSAEHQSSRKVFNVRTPDGQALSAPYVPEPFQALKVQFGPGSQLAHTMAHRRCQVFSPVVSYGISLLILLHVILLGPSDA